MLSRIMEEIVEAQELVINVIRMKRLSLIKIWIIISINMVNKEMDSTKT